MALDGDEGSRLARAAPPRLADVHPGRVTDFAALERATADLDPPFAVVDLAALRANADDLTRRAHGTPLRVATKSVRCRAVTDAVLARPGFRGVLALTLPEALWLADTVTDVVVGYPTADRGALRRLVADERLAARVTVMIDSVEQLEFIESTVGGSAPVRVCLDLDASLRLLGDRVHLGVRRSPVHRPADAVELARAVLARPRFTLVGVMSYEAQIAGMGDSPGGRGPATRGRGLAIRAMQRASARELRLRREEAVRAVQALAPLEFVNGGGTGSVEATAREAVITDVAAGSGLYGPALFDTYRRFSPRPAALFALSVVRRPSPTVATVLGGGWTASGAPGFDRLPTPVWPGRLRLGGTEGAGEAQTPLFGPGAAGLRVGERVWFRHTKAGELCEHVDELHLVDGDHIVATVPTYRGEGHTFL